jgi:hypothetical protein
VKSVPKLEYAIEEIRERFDAYKTIREVVGGDLEIVQWRRLMRVLDLPASTKDMSDANRLRIRRLGGPHGKAYYKALLIRLGVK